MSLYLISDTHFGHENIIKYENRPFASASEMDETIIRNWNNTISSTDTVICLGDFSFYSKEKTKSILDQLNGIKELILGNHDTDRSIQWWQEVGFSQVYRYPICIDDFFWLSHAPMYMNRNMPYCNLHGHIHSQRLEDTTQFINLSVEHTNYCPILFDDIKRKCYNNSVQS